ncbi:hypothetical protein FACS189475_05670 [Betaproteobacteria bacterium]|nr:hypothetical protein FACS189475_05670 [Betaproteobacteria bacterium]
MNTCVDLLCVDTFTVRGTDADNDALALNLIHDQNTLSHFTALTDLSAHLQLDFTRTRADRATGTVSYDVSITNIGQDDLNGPMKLILDPGRYFTGDIANATGADGERTELWVIDLTAALREQERMRDRPRFPGFRRNDGGG